MTLRTPKFNDFSGGGNNLASADRLPEEFYRESINLDPVNGGKLSLRAGYGLVAAGTAIRGALSLRGRILLADGAMLREFDTRTNTLRDLSAIAASGFLAGCEHNGELFFCTANEALRYDGTSVRRWGVPTVNAQPPATTLAGGSLKAGAYAYAATFTDASGVEGGTAHSGVITAQDGQALSFALPAPPTGGQTHLYLGYHNSTTLYRQGYVSAAGALVVHHHRDNTRTLDTQFMDEPPVGDIIESHRGVILIAVGNTLHMTAPLKPHIRQPLRGFFQFPAPITMVKSVQSGVFVSADRTYFLAGLESEPQQSMIHDSPAIKGSAFTLPDKRVTWMSAYGQVIGAPDGSLQFITDGHYAPMLASQAGGGYLEHNGNKLALTTMRGLPQHSRLAAGDYYDAEIIYP